MCLQNSQKPNTYYCFIGVIPKLILCVANTKNLLNPSHKKILLNLSQICDICCKFVSLDEPLGTVDWDSQICNENNKHKKLPRQHFLHHLTILSHFYFIVPSPCWPKQRGRYGGAGGRVKEQDPSKRGQWTLVMPPSGGCAVHLRMPAMAAALREGATKIAVQERASWQMQSRGAARGNM